MSPSQKIINTNPPIVVEIMMNVPVFGANSGHHTIQMDELCVKYLSDALEVTSPLSCYILIKYPMLIGDQFKSQAVKRTFYRVTIPAYLAVNLMFLSPKKEKGTQILGDKLNKSILNAIYQCHMHNSPQKSHWWYFALKKRSTKEYTNRMGTSRGVSIGALDSKQFPRSNEAENEAEK